MKWFRRKNKSKLPDKDAFYVLAWGEQSGLGVRYFSFTGSYGEILDVIGKLSGKGPVFTELDIQPFDKHQLPRDMHWHTIDGKPDYHSWDDCPENIKKDFLFVHTPSGYTLMEG